MALLYYLNAGLQEVPPATNIDTRFIRLVENLDRFNRYTLGAYIYKLTISSLNGIFYNATGICKVPNASGMYDLKGFSLAF